MRRTHVVVLSAVMVLVTLFVGRGALAAQDPDLADHPLVGSWVVDADTEDPENLPEMVIISSDGTVSYSAAGGLTGVGVWEPTGDTAAIVTISLLFDDGWQLMIRASVEVSPDGHSFTSPYTNEFFDATGQGSGEIGPGTAEGVRMTVEGPGTPVASFDEFFAEPEGTPGATPVT